MINLNVIFPEKVHIYILYKPLMVLENSRNTITGQKWSNSLMGELGKQDFHALQQHIISFMHDKSNTGKFSTYEFIYENETELKSHYLLWKLRFLKVPERGL